MFEGRNLITNGKPAFICQRCGQCCLGHGGVWLNSGQVTNIASYLAVTQSHLIDTCLEFQGRLWTVKNGHDGFCIFFDKEKKSCRIHRLKPLSCRYWPFYSFLLKNEGGFLEAQNICKALFDWDYPTFLAAFKALNIPDPPKSLKKASLEA
jgi:Fe-S-cluster containining protein